MKKYVYYISLFLFVSLSFMSMKVFADSTLKRKDRCELGATSCYNLSNGFTEPYCVDSKTDLALECVWPSVTNNLSSFRSSDLNNLGSAKSLASFEMRDFVQQYCKSLLGEGNSGRIYFAKPSAEEGSKTWDWQQTFDSHQSLFVYSLCSSFKENGKIIFTGDFKDKEFSEVLTKDARNDLVTTLKLRQKSGGKDLCSLDDFYNIEDCDMSIYATEIFSTIMSDVFKIKYAQVLDIDKADGYNKSDKIMQFMTGYFFANKTDNYDEFYTKFPQTVDVLESNQRFYLKVLDTVKIINNSELADRASVTGCPVKGNMVGKDFIACALHSSQGKGSALTPAFVTLIYNEIMSYHVFQEYLNTWINNKIVSESNSDNKSRLLNKTLDFAKYSEIQIQATKMALRSFTDFNMTYPFHIGLLLYQEVMKNFRDKHLSPIVTIFYSLSEKLQNVQLPN